MRLSFVKMHSLGNDFIVVDAVRSNIKLTAESIRLLTDRRHGVGCDQLLVAEAASDVDCDFFFRVYNTDGSESGQCGNGVRCFHRFLIEQGLTTGSSIRHQTSTTTLITHTLDDAMVAVDIGEPIFEPARIPFLADAAENSYKLTVDDSVLSVGAVSMGNPHAVLFEDEVTDSMVAALGPKIENHSRFPKRTNVGFAQIVDRSRLNLRVFERGVGETLACGSGACAAVAVGVRQQRLDESVAVKLPGGELSVQWHGPGSRMTLVGSAERVFDGEIEINTDLG